MAFSSPCRRVALGLLSPSPRVCTGVRTYADVRPKTSLIDRLPNFLTHGAPLYMVLRSPLGCKGDPLIFCSLRATGIAQYETKEKKNWPFLVWRAL